MVDFSSSISFLFPLNGKRACFGIPVARALGNPQLGCPARRGKPPSTDQSDHFVQQEKKTRAYKYIFIYNWVASEAMVVLPVFQSMKTNQYFPFFVAFCQNCDTKLNAITFQKALSQFIITALGENAFQAILAWLRRYEYMFSQLAVVINR